jgi:hypothetical protein
MFTNWNYKLTKLLFQISSLNYLFLSLETGTNTRTIGAKSFTFGPNLGGQLVVTTKPVSPIRGGTSLEIIPLLVVTVTILVDTSSFVVNSIKRALKFLFIIIQLIPPHIGIGL